MDKHNMEAGVGIQGSSHLGIIILRTGDWYHIDQAKNVTNTMKTPRDVSRPNTATEN